MSDQYYLSIDREKVGPLTGLQVTERIGEGDVGADTLAWARGMEGWGPLSSFPEFADAFFKGEEEIGGGEDVQLDSPPPLPTETMGTPAAPAAPAARVARVAPADEAWEPQPFRLWTRFAARVIDTIVLLMVVGFVVSLVAAPLVLQLGNFSLLVLIAATFLVEAGLLCSFGTTPGKALFGITVRSHDGQILSWGSALRRSLLVWLRGMALGFPLLVPALTLLAPVLMALCYMEVKRRGDILWDREQGLRVSYREPKPVALGLAAAILLGFIALMGQAFYMIKTGNFPPGFQPPPGFEWPVVPESEAPEPASFESDLTV